MDGHVVDAELEAVEQQSVDAWLEAELDDVEQSVAGALLLEASCANAGATFRAPTMVAMTIIAFMELPPPPSHPRDLEANSFRRRRFPSRRKGVPSLCSKPL
jgi:hypothetical protein